ncbi:hypothetical protein SAMN02745166_02837 [Prosthecobacter debontii]|uniref:Plasmid stabilization system protein ParE n=1 Tax=Prosthecobacter debontii TaxID=48467 RepID=A0A1T4YAG0_9BACT|nr:hypothetical protein [Prosthecobacter debontii]SKA98683.1 hypothetical protein SAMN02745166_02837 [Prosthecobacter debontii]
MKVLVTSDALGDLQQSYAFYERQEKGLGTYFRQCITKDLTDLQMTAGIHSAICGYLHVNSVKFNSIIYYRVEKHIAVVKAIVDGRIAPEKRDRILKRRI